MDLLPNWTLTFDPTSYVTTNTSYGLLAKVAARLRPAAGAARGRSRSRPEPRRPAREPDLSGNDAHSDRQDRLQLLHAGPGRLRLRRDATWRCRPTRRSELSPAPRLRSRALGLRYDHMGYRYDDRLGTPETPRYRRPADATPGYDHLSPKLGLTFQVSDSLNAFASYRHAFRAPSEGQLFRQGSALEHDRARARDGGELRARPARDAPETRVPRGVGLPPRHARRHPELPRPGRRLDAGRERRQDAPRRRGGRR